MKKAIITLCILLLTSLQPYAAVDLNTASQVELETLIGIGPSKAQATIDFRKKHGGFESTDELVKVDGIGAGTLKKLEKKISVKKKKIAVPSEGKIPSSIPLD